MILYFSEQSRSASGRVLPPHWSIWWNMPNSRISVSPFPRRYKLNLSQTRGFLSHHSPGGTNLDSVELEGFCPTVLQPSPHYIISHYTSVTLLKSTYPSQLKVDVSTYIKIKLCPQTKCFYLLSFPDDGDDEGGDGPDERHVQGHHGKRVRRSLRQGKRQGDPRQRLQCVHHPQTLPDGHLWVWLPGAVSQCYKTYLIEIL